MVRSEEIGVHWAPCFYIKRERVLLENLWKILRSQISVRSQGSHPRVMLSQSLPTSPCCQLWGIGKWWAPQTSMKKCSMCLSAHVEVKGQLLRVLSFHIGLWGSNSGRQPWWQVSSCTEPSLQPHIFFIHSSVIEYLNVLFTLVGLS